MPRYFIQVFRGEITNTEVESIVWEKKYFMRGLLMFKSNSFERAAVEVTMTQPSSFPQWEKDLLFQDLRNDFELIPPTLSSHWENHRHHFSNEGSTFQGWTAVLCHHLMAKGRGLTLRYFPSQLSILLSGIYLYCLSSFPSVFLIRLFLYPLLFPISPCTHLYHWWHPASENGWNYLIVGPFHFHV